VGGKENSKKSVYLSVVIPLFDEADSLKELHSQLETVLGSLPFTSEVIFVDDGSTDASMQVLTELYESDKRVRVFQFRKNYGKSAALAKGFAEAFGEIIITMDADLQDDPAEITELVSRIEEGNDLVSGWKKNRYDPFFKRHTSKIYNSVTCKMTGVKLHDINCGLKAYRREVTDSLNVYGQLHRYLPVLAQWEGFKVDEMVVRHHPRKYGKSKFGLSRFMAGFFDLITVLFITRYTKRPLHLFGSVGLLTFSSGFLINVWLAYERIFNQQYLSKKPLLFLGILLIIVGVQFFSVGLLGEMITANRQNKIDYAIKKTLP